MRLKLLFPILIFAIMSYSAFGLIQVSTCEQLQNLTNKSDNVTLINDIDCSDTVNWNGGTGFVPIVNWTGSYFDGQGYTIRGLYINRTDLNSVALFNTLSSSQTIKNLKISGFNIHGNTSVATLCGGNLTTIYSTTTPPSSATGCSAEFRNISVSDSQIYGNLAVAGLVAFTFPHTGIDNVSVTNVSISCDGLNYAYYMGGIVGRTTVRDGSSHIYNVYVDTTIKRDENSSVPLYFVGGIGGRIDTDGNYNSVGIYRLFVHNTSISGEYEATQFLGGVFGYARQYTSQGTIEVKFARVDADLTTLNSSVTNQYLGGLIGDAYDRSAATWQYKVTNSVVLSDSLSPITSKAYYGAIFGDVYDLASITTNALYFNNQSGVTVCASADSIVNCEGMVKEDFKQQSNVPALEFVNHWYLWNGHTYPMLRVFEDRYNIHPIDSCGDISENYDQSILMSNISVNGTCLNVTASSFDLDGNGYWFVGSGSSDDVAIYSDNGGAGFSVISGNELNFKNMGAAFYIPHESVTSIQYSHFQDVVGTAIFTNTTNNSLLQVVAYNTFTNCSTATVASGEVVMINNTFDRNNIAVDLKTDLYEVKLNHFYNNTYAIRFFEDYLLDAVGVYANTFLDNTNTYYSFATFEKVFENYYGSCVASPEKCHCEDPFVSDGVTDEIPAVSLPMPFCINVGYVQEYSVGDFTGVSLDFISLVGWSLKDLAPLIGFVFAVVLATSVFVFVVHKLLYFKK